MILDTETSKALSKYLPGILANIERKTAHEADLLKKESEWEEAHSDNHRIYTFFDEVNSESVKTAVDTIGLWSRRDIGEKEKEIIILLNSPGGYCIEGFALIDWIVALRKELKSDIQIIGLGQVSSMASIIMQAASTRVMMKNAWMLIHEVALQLPQGYYDQKISNIEEEVDFGKRIELQGTKLLASRSNVTVNEILERTFKTDWWISAKEALKLGLIDEVR